MHLSDSTKIVLDVASGVAPISTTPIVLGASVGADPAISEIALYAGLIAALLSILWNGGRVIGAIYKWFVEDDEE